MDMKSVIWTVFLAATLLVTACKKDPEVPSSEAELTALLQEEVERQDIPALSALVFKDDQTIYDEYFGQSNVADNVALAPDHVFLIASISKVVTGIALLQLVDDNQIGLDDPINPHLPFQVQVPGASQAITFRMLLTHTAAIADGPSLDNEYYYNQDSPKALGTFLEDYFTPGSAIYSASDNFHNADPGDAFEYSNVGSALVGYLVERISGQPFDQYCQANIFGPLGMDRTYWRLENIPGPIVQPYESVGGGNEAVPHYTFTDYPNGALRTTGRDLFQLFQAFANQGNSNGVQVLEPGTIASMMTLQVPDLSDDSGLHFFVMDEERGIWGHDGGERGVATIAGVHPQTKVGVILFANHGDAELEALMISAYEYGLNQ